MAYYSPSELLLRQCFSQFSSTHFSFVALLLNPSPPLVQPAGYNGFSHLLSANPAIETPGWREFDVVKLRNRTNTDAGQPLAF